MKIKKVKEAGLGLFRIYWKSGGSSLAAIGQNEEGSPWIVPVNWLSPLQSTSKQYRKYIRGIKRLERLPPFEDHVRHLQTEQCPVCGKWKNGKDNEE